MKRAVTILLLAVAIGASLFLVLRMRMPRLRLPFRGGEALRANLWQDYGGLWSAHDGTIFNRSDELGAKLVAGSPLWTNYGLSADMRMLGHRGEVGVIVRVNDMGEGINAYRGYYAGFRSMDNSLILGFSDRDWIEARPVPLPTHLQLNDWLHINVVAVGCDIGAELTIIRTGETIRSLMHQDDCVVQGRIGLRSLSSGAAWKNVVAVSAGMKDLDEIRRYVPAAGAAIYPTREDDLVRMLMAEPSTPDRFFSDFARDKDGAADVRELTSARPIGSLNTSLSMPLQAVLQGTVTHVDPLYIQDPSGGIAVRSAIASALNLGDELEVAGQAVHTSEGVFFDAARTRLLWDDVSTRPVAITSDQAASGEFQGSLVELSGRLLARTTSPDDKIYLRMSSGREEFSVVVQASLAHRAAKNWEVGSTLRVRGVCAFAQPHLPPADLFQILPRSVADIQVVSGPPWNSGIRLVFIMAFAVLLLSAIVFVYMRAERWKMRTIYEERERLAADMHDTLAQGFAGVGYQLQSVRRGLRENASVPEHLMRRLDAACELAIETHREASTRITALHFAADEEYDVLEVLHRAIILMTGSDSTLAVISERSGSRRFLALSVRDALFRIGHEAIANVLRHSHATSLRLRLVFQAEGVRLEVEDNGVGIANPEKNGFGIDSMRARADECNGFVKIDSEASAGTKVTVYLPYQKHRQVWRRARGAAARVFRQSPARPFRQGT